jgi:hypothetical protein
MSVPVKNIPIGLKNVVTSFEGVSESSELHLSSITLFPGSQPDPTATFVRNWNFNIAGKIVSTGISSFSIVMDLSEVVPSYVIDFKGALYGTLQIGSHLYASDKHIVLVPDNEKKQITLVVTLECPRKSFVFSLNSTISDGGSSSITWTDQTTVASGTTWLDSAISTTGKYQAAVNSTGTVYVSSDYGSSWTGVSTGASVLVSVAVSGTGQYMYAGDEYVSSGAINYIYMSSDYGASWSTLSGSSISGGRWFGLACSSDGTSYLYAINNSSSGFSIYQFTGLTNTSPTVTNITPSGGYSFSLNGIACSVGGTTVILVGTNNNYSSTSVLKYTSSTWSTPLTTTTVLSAVAMSGDGTVMYAISSGALEISTDSGSTWSSVSTPSSNASYRCISCSVDGNTVLVGCTNTSPVTSAVLYLSTTQGSANSWVQQTPVVTGYLFGCSMNSDATYLIATGYSGDLWTGNDTSS